MFLFIFHQKPLICQNCGSQVMDQNPPDQSDCRIFYSVISQERARDHVEFLHVDKHQSFLQVDTTVFDGCGCAFPKYQKYQVCNILAISQKRGEG